MSSRRAKPKLCPYFRKPCIEDGCEHWKGFPMDRVNDMGVKVTETQYMCNDHWMSKMLYDIAGFTDYTGRATNQVRNHIAEGNAALGGLVYAANKRLKNDDQSRDRKQIGQPQGENPLLTELDAPAGKNGGSR